MRKLQFVVPIAVALLAPAIALSQGVPPTLSYQGRLLKINGDPETGPIAIRFSFFPSATSTSPVWTEEQNVALDNGFFSAFLGDQTSLAGVFDGRDLWLELSVREAAMTPRQRVASAPYALVCGSARNVNGGSINATSVSVNGQPVVTGVGAAAPLTSSGGASPVIGIKSCTTAGQVLKYNGSTWDCGNDALGTATVIGATAPLTSTGGANPQIGIAKATSTSDGYLTSTDYNAFSAKLSSVATGTGLSGNGTSGNPLAIGEQVYVYSGAFSTPTEWEADILANKNYGRFCQAIGKTFVRASELAGHYNPGRTNGFAYDGWYYAGPQYCAKDTLYAGNGITTDPQNVWQYKGGCGCCPIIESWTTERRALITCR